MIYKRWDIDVVGVLATDDYVATKRDGEAVFINRQNSLQFLVRIISETPESFPNVNLFTGYSSDIEKYGFEENFLQSEFLRKDTLRNFLNDYLIVFKPNRKGDHFHIKDVRLVPKPNAFSERSTFVPIPVFSEKKHQQTFGEFLAKLKHNKFVGKIDGISIEYDDTPGLVFWRNEDYTFKVVGEFESHRYAYGGFQFQYNELKEFNIQEEWLDDAFEVPENETLMFVGNETYHKMVQEMELTSALDLEEYEQNTMLQELEAENITSVHEMVQEEEKPSSEEEFLDHLVNFAREQGLLYHEKDLINFHTAMKSSTIVILAGMSGTGKSKLVQMYGKALGMDDIQLNIIPVRPSWTDDADLIGYVDSIHMVYRPGDSGLINTLIEASKAENVHNRIYIVCFDEMNLARVEHYFSQFLSVLEMEPTRRQLRLYNEQLEAKLYNSYQYPPVINIGDNVMFVGTVNIDESTYHFSDKVLDRANVINLNVLPFEKLKELRDERKRKSDRKEWTLTEFREFRNQIPTIELADREISFLREIHELLNSVNKNMGVGFRIVRQIDSFLKNLPQNYILPRNEAFDLQVVQRILTKVRGPEDQLKSLIGSYKTEINQTTKSSLIELVDRYNDVSHFKETRKIILHKSKELKAYGYTI